MATPLRYLDWDGKPREETKYSPWARQLAFVGLFLCVGGLVLSPAVLSIGAVTAIIPAFVAYPLKEQWRRFWSFKPAVLLSLIFLFQVVSGLWTLETQADIWAELIKIKAPFLFTAYSFAVLGPYPARWVRWLLMLLLLTCCITCTGTVLQYILNKDQIDAQIQSSKEISVWTGINHIYFSIICAFSVLGGAWLLRHKAPALFKGEKWVIGALALANFAMMHVLTTRTGLVGLYLTAVIIGFLWVIKEKRYLLGVLALAVLLAMPIAGYYGVASFSHRVDNTFVDISRYFSGKDPNYLSIGTRLESWKAAIHIFQKHPVQGVAMADIRPAMLDQYIEDQTQLCPENFVMPHNQFLLNLAGMGALGFLILCLAWFYPALQRRIPKDPLFWSFWILSTLSMLGESTLERQVGVNFTVPFLLLTLGVAIPNNPPFRKPPPLSP